jgi:hypothetical protein
MHTGFYHGVFALAAVIIGVNAIRLVSGVVIQNTDPNSLPAKVAERFGSLVTWGGING